VYALEKIMTSLRGTVVNNLYLEWLHLKQPKIFTGIGVGVLMAWIHLAAHNYAYFLADKYGIYGGKAGQLKHFGIEALSSSLVYSDLLPPIYSHTRSSPFPLLL
jgi:hypothetical protein